jgi:spermidine synthase
MGLFGGSWFGDRITKYFHNKFNIKPITLYGITELLIGVGALFVPFLYSIGESSLLNVGALNGANYLLFSGVFITVAILPWTFLMGLTFPVMMSFVKYVFKEKSSSGFSYLYLANVIGAMCGVLTSANILIEVLGFSKATYVSVVGNCIIALISFYIARFNFDETAESSEDSSNEATTDDSQELQLAPIEKGFAYTVLFITGFLSMGLEVVWTRGYAPVLKTTIYSFAFLLTIYLLATWIGSFAYRYLRQKKKVLAPKVLLPMVLFSIIFSLVITDPRNPLKGSKMVTISVFLFCLILGYLTPMIIDRYSNGDPDKAGRAYAFNVLGCILGPLMSGYFLMPTLGMKGSILVLIFIFFAIILYLLRDEIKKMSFWKSAGGAFVILSIALLPVGSFYSVTYDFAGLYKDSVVRRDYSATVISTTDNNGFKRLLVNGFGITILSSLVKFMAHVPLAFLDKKPENALVICFGMGTTYRSLLTWDINTTAVELTPSVVDSFDYYHKDAKEVLNNPKGNIVIDDGRRFLKRTDKKYDLITLDPPPPVEAAGSGLLYSKEFVELLKERLTDKGILAHWFPGSDGLILNAVSRSIHKVFPYIKVFRGLEKGKNTGYHFFASKSPIPDLGPEQLLAKIPEKSINDLMEWYDSDETPQNLLKSFFKGKVEPANTLGNHEGIMVSDDFPYNEYYRVRRKLLKHGLEKWLPMTGN